MKASLMHQTDDLVSLGGQRVERAAASYRKAKAAYDDARYFWPGSDAEAKAWRALEDARADYGPRHPAKPKPLSDRMNVGE